MPDALFAGDFGLVKLLLGKCQITFFSVALRVFIQPFLHLQLWQMPDALFAGDFGLVKLLLGKYYISCCPPLASFILTVAHA
jgi:hypothetical protein